MTIVKHYRENAELRASFNALAEATFGLNFENWYTLGYWGDNYVPYSVLEDGKIVANVSVNRTDMVLEGQRTRLYQLGTVMTHPDYRNRGYIRAIMAESTFRSGSAMVDNPGLIFFYVAQFMQENVYTVGNTWIIAEEEEGNLVIHNVFGPEETSLDAVIAAFGPEVKTVTLGFTPADRTGWNSEELKEEDTTFFTRGAAFEKFAERKLRIPSLSHA